MMRVPLPSWLLLLALGACAAPHVQAVAPQPPVQAAAPQPCVQDGVASWYAPRRGRVRMADGRRLNSAALTAAHRFLPFGTKVRVTDLATGRSVVVLITDRGPFPRGRIIDVSPAAARILDMRRAGIAPVQLQIDGADDTLCLLRVAVNWSLPLSRPSPPQGLATDRALATAFYGAARLN
jgi:rare lipoprotein A (peptidoglycan hydrolase)